VKVVDFGLARRVESEEIISSPSLSGGTLRYMSPEQARGESVFPASGVFSFGLVLYELATGRHAFPSDSLILAMLAKDSAARPTAEEIARKLTDLQGLREISPALVRELGSG